MPNNEKLIEQKDLWMASHITDAEYPTPQSIHGLELYQTYQQQLTTSPSELLSDFSASLLSFYPVDCHPLTIRYSVIQASHWENDEDKEAVIEYLTQIMFEASSPAQLYVGFYKGKPAACGMIFSKEDTALIADVQTLPLSNATELKQEMCDFLRFTASNNHQSIALQK